MISSGKVNLPHVKAEVEAVFQRYEAALMSNDLTALDAHFWNDPRVVRFGSAENLYGIDAIRAYRSARDASGVSRQLVHPLITTFGENAAVATTEFIRAGQTGRQTQNWIRFPEGWRIVSAHVSLLAPPV